MRKLAIGILMMLRMGVFAQDSAKDQSSSVSFSGYVEAYYGYDFNKPGNNNRPVWRAHIHRNGRWFQTFGASLMRTDRLEELLCGGRSSGRFKAKTISLLKATAYKVMIPLSPPLSH